MRQIERHVPASSLIKLGVDGSELSKVDTVLAHLSHASIAHFACHGVQNLANPLESALLLDGQLKVSTIMAQSLPKASLAFLSACETAKGTVELPDEAMHLAGTMLFSGFRSVVATKWSVSLPPCVPWLFLIYTDRSIYDDDGPKIADEFYGYLFKNHEDGSAPDTTESARALHLAVKKLRAQYNDHSFVRWVPFVHYGL